MKKLSKTLIGIIAMVAVIGLFQTGCGEKSEKEKTISGTVTADSEGKILFMYSRTKNHPDFCTFTTNLPSPNDRFVVTIASGESTGKKEIAGLTAGQKVEWTATVEGNPLNHGSGNFVHIVN